MVRSTFTLFAALALFSVSAAAQTAGSQAAGPGQRTDVYHVHFTKAAPGQAGPLGDSLATPDPKAAMPGHFIVLRHQEGDDWDYCVIEHLGTKTTVDASPSPIPPAVRDLSAWHSDTFVSGPPWAEFARAMAIDGSSKAGSNPVYIVSIYRAVTGHREKLDEMLKQPGTAGKVETGSVLMQHLEGGPWNFLTVARYNSWADLATDRASAAANPSAANGWTELRQHVVSHHDTIADRVAVKQSAEKQED